MYLQQLVSLCRTAASIALPYNVILLAIYSNVISTSPDDDTTTLFMALAAAGTFGLCITAHLMNKAEGQTFTLEAYTVFLILLLGFQLRVLPPRIGKEMAVCVALFLNCVCAASVWFYGMAAEHSEQVKKRRRFK